MTKNCYFKGPQVGTLRCSCSGSANVQTCFNEEQNPNGLCSDYTRAEMPEGKIIRKGETPKEDDPTHLIFPYRQKDVDKGHPIHDDWIIRCDQCPWHTPEPPEIATKRTEAAEIAAWLRQYEEADSLEERARMLRP